MKRTHKTKRQIIEDVLRDILFNDKAFAKFKIHKLETKISYWKYQQNLIQVKEEKNRKIQEFR